VLFSAQKCQVVLDYGGYNMVHHKVLHKKQLHVHGHVKQVDVVQVQVELLLIRVQQLVKVNKKLKLFFHNHSVQVHRHQVDQLQVDRPAVVSIHNHHLQLVDHQAQATVEHGILVLVVVVLSIPVLEIQVQPFLVLEHQVAIQALEYLVKPLVQEEDRHLVPTVREERLTKKLLRSRALRD
jgi:hypothetical protein